MTQTKLKEASIEDLKQARNGIENGVVWGETDEGHEYWQEVVALLDAKIKHGTSDGKPYIDPEPVIPEGWRKAEPDEWRRRDVKFWKSKDKIWLLRAKSGPFDQLKTGTHYIVPIDPPLTDEDACVLPRLKVMVRDYETEEWHGPYRYLGKNAKDSYPYIVDPDRSNSRTWKQARRATPEEIEAAK